MIAKIRKEKGLWLNCWSVSLSFIMLFTFSFLDISCAAEFPTKTIQIIAGFPPGGGADSTPRTINNKLSILLGQPVIVSNKVGGGGIIATYGVKAAPPDGHTILSFTSSFLTMPLVTKDVTYHPTKDFTPINFTMVSPEIIGVRNDSRFKTLEALIAEAKKNPGKLTCGLSSMTGASRWATELFKMKTGTDFTLVPLEGVTGALTGVLGGHVDFGIFELVGMPLAQLKAGELRSLVTMATKRHKDFPEVPTSVEKGFPDLIHSVFYGFVVRSETPQIIVEKLEKSFQKVLNDKEIILIFEKEGGVVENLGSGEAKKFMARELQKCIDIAKAANIIPK